MPNELDQAKTMNTVEHTYVKPVNEMWRTCVNDFEGKSELR